MIAGRIERDGLGADADAEIDLSAGRCEDGAITDDIGAVLLRANCVRRKRRRLGQRRNAEPRRDEAGEQTVDMQMIPGHLAFSLLLRFLSARKPRRAASHGVASENGDPLSVSETH